MRTLGSEMVFERPANGKGFTLYVKLINFVQREILPDKLETNYHKSRQKHLNTLINTYNLFSPYRRNFSFIHFHLNKHIKVGNSAGLVDLRALAERRSVPRKAGGIMYRQTHLA